MADVYTFFRQSYSWRDLSDSAAREAFFATALALRELAAVAHAHGLDKRENAKPTPAESLFTMRHLDAFVPADHPLRSTRVLAHKALVNLDGLFSQMYAAGINGGSPRIAPEKLLRAAGAR